MPASLYGIFCMSQCCIGSRSMGYAMFLSKNAKVDLSLSLRLTSLARICRILGDGNRVVGMWPAMT